MEIVFGIVILLVVALLGIFIFNNKLNLNNLQIAYIIVGIVCFSTLLLLIMYNPHSECDMMINVNDASLETLQDKCFKYINF